MAEKHSAKYEINMAFRTGEAYGDFTSITFLRVPLAKHSSFVIVRITIPVAVAKAIEGDANRSMHTGLDLRIYNLDDNDKKVNLIFEKPYKVLTIHFFEEIDYTRPSCQVEMVLVNPTLHAIGSSHAFNTIIENYTALGCITRFESFLAETYGPNFYSNHVGKSVKQNTFVYENILTNVKVDANFPTYLIQTYKPFHSYSFYFMDDFNLHPKAKKHITCHLINFYDPNQFERFDVSTYADIYHGTKYLGKSNFSDQFNDLLKHNETLNFITKDGAKTVKMSTAASASQISYKQESKDELMKGRDIGGTTGVQEQKKTVGQSIDHSNIYVPDTVENAISRIDTLREIITEKVEVIEHYETRNCAVDWLQFGRLYNLDRDSQASYIYTPLAITNIFTRISQKENFVRHSARYSMIKYYKKK